MSAPFRPDRLDGLAAFLAGAGLGAALARRLPEPAWSPAGIRGGALSGQGRTAVAASLGRMQALLGEIRGLMGERGERGERGPRAGDPSVPAAPAADAGELPAADAGGRSVPEASSAREAWRLPDRIGYGIPGGAPDPMGSLALCAAAAGAAAAYAAIRRNGWEAAWPALAGFLAAGAWAAAGGRRRASPARRRAPAPMGGPGRSRSGAARP